MLLFLMGASTGAAYAVANPGVTDVKITQQSGTCTGIVKDATGETVIGASVVVKGTTNGTITGLDGDFSLSNVKKGDIIVISFVGYQTQEVKWTGQPIDVTLKDDTQQLGEVVVTALGLKREEKALGYAVTEVKGDELKAANTISPVAALQGKVAGVEISGSDGGLFGGTKIQIRGASTLSSNNQPIYVVDGVILDNGVSGNTTADWDAGANNASDYGNELKNLNPDDFETVSVLKGAAATALYGSRGLNGAVVITTKSGKGTQGLGISVSQTFGIDHAFKTPDIQTLYGPGYMPGQSDADQNGSMWDEHQFTVNQNGEHTLVGVPNFGFGPRYDGSQIRNYDGTWTTYSPRKNNMLDLYKLGFNTNTNVSIRGGNEKTSFYTSLSYKNAKSTTENNTFERYSMLLKASHKLNDWVDVAASFSFANSKPRNAQLNAGELFVNANTNVINPLFDVDYFRNKYLGEHGGIASTSYGDQYGSVPSSAKNYFFKVDNYDYVRKETVIRPTFEVNVKMTDWLKFKADANMNRYYTSIEDKQLGSGYANEGGYYGITQDIKEQFTVGGTFTASKQIKDFSLGGFARFEYYNTSSQHSKVSTDGGMVVPGEWFVENSKKTKKSESTISGSKRIISAIFALNLGWKNQVYLDVTGRNDWSSALVYANRTGNHSYFYPSVSGSWLINETFRESMPSWINLAKLRASWAQVGNDTDPYAVNQTYSFATMEMYDGNIYTNELDKLMKIADLKPERKNSWEIGLDFRTFNNRLNLDFTYYKENTTDQIMKINVPAISGVTQQLVNAGNDTDPYAVNQTYSFATMEMYDGNIYTNELDKLMKIADLKPERKNSWEIGLDFRTFNNRLNLDFTYYKENTTDQIMKINVPAISGVTQQLVNAGNIQNSGIEIALNTTPIKTKDWQWDLDFTYTRNRSKIVSLHPNVANYIELSGYVNAYDYHIGSVAKVGESYGVLMSDVTQARNENGVPLLEWDDSWRGAYRAQSKTAEVVGNMTPDFLGSVATTLTWKDLSLNVGLDMRFGGLVASYCNLYGTQAGWTESSLQYRDPEHGGMTWTSQYADSKGIQYTDGMIPEGVFKEGTIATLVDGTKMDVSGLSYAQLVQEGKLEPTHAGSWYGNNYSWGAQTIDDIWVHKLSYIALRNITINYRLPNSISHKLGAKGLNLSFSARNLGYLYNSLPNNLNPESVRSNSASEFRIRGFEPYTASYIFTINANF